MGRINLHTNLSTTQYFTNFGALGDVVIIHIFDLNNNFVASINVNRDDWYIKSTSIDGNPIGSANATVISIENVLKKNNFTDGTYNISINFLRPLVINVPIEEISADRTELKFNMGVLSSLGQGGPAYDIFNESYKLHFDGHSGTKHQRPLIIDLGQNLHIPIINFLSLDHSKGKYEATENKLLVKLLNPLPDDVEVANISAIMADTFTNIVNIESPPIEEPFTLLHPNFELDYDISSTKTTVHKTWNEILSTGNTTTQQLISNIISGSVGEGIKLNIDYRSYADFIHFSSAEERLRNFHYKMQLLETYRTDMDEVRNLDNATSPEALSNIAQYERKIDNLLNTFDGYENYLYYDSGSFFSGSGNVKFNPSTWPKYSTTKPYSNVSASSPVAKKWFGSTAANNTYFGGQVMSASLYDRENNDMLVKALPSFIIEDSTNTNLLTYVHMMGQHYDILFNYIKHLPKIHEREESADLGTPRDMLFAVAKSLGISLFNGNVDEELWSYALGTRIDGTTDQTGTGFTSGSLKTLSGHERTTEIWNRLINNLPLLLKAKGTERGLRALINCYGVPSSILRITEFGGPEAEDENSQLAINRYANALRFDGNSMVNRYWRVLAKNHKRPINTFPNTIEMRIKSAGPQNSVLWNIYQSSPNRIYSSLILEHSASAHMGYEKNKSPYARLTFFTSGSDEFDGHGGIISCSTAYGPIGDGDWWNIMIRRTEPTGSNVKHDQRKQPHRFDIFAKKAGDHSQGRITHTLSASTRTISGSHGSGSGWIINENGSNGIIGIGETGASYSDTSYLGVPPDIQTLNPTGFSGSMQEYREWATALNESAFDQHVQNPNCIVGNNYSSSYYDLTCRLRMGTDLKTYTHNTTTTIPSAHPQSGIKSFFTESIGVVAEHVDGIMIVGWSTFGNDYEDVEEVYYINMPSTIGNRGIGDKIRIENNTLDTHMWGDWANGKEHGHQHLDVETSYEETKNAIKRVDTNRLGIYLSPSTDVNIDIANNIGQTRLDDFLGDPRDSYNESYKELAAIRKEYFQKYKGQRGIWDYIRQIEMFDGSLFKILNKFIPRKASEVSGLLIEPTILERPKIQNRRPTLTEDEFPDVVVISYDSYQTGSNDRFVTSSMGRWSADIQPLSCSIQNLRRSSDSIVYTFTSSMDINYVTGSDGSPYEMLRSGLVKIHSRHGYNFREDGSRYPQTQVVKHAGTGNYTQGSMSLQLTPVGIREAFQPCITGSRVSQIYKKKNYFYSSSISASRHQLYLQTGEWRGPFEYSRDERVPLMYGNLDRPWMQGVHGKVFGSLKGQAYKSEEVFAETNLDDNVGCHRTAFEGTKITAPDFNRDGDGPYGGPVVSWFETNPNKLFAADKPSGQFGNILLSGDILPGQKTDDY